MRRRSDLPLAALSSREACFIEPMECLAVTKLPEGSQWTYEIKLDGYRALAVKSDGKVHLYSRRKKPFNSQYPYLVEALNALPDDTVVDGEVVSLDDSGKPNFHLIQQYRKEASRIHYFIFDLLICRGRDLTGLPLNQRREFLQQFVKTNSRIRISGQFQVSAVEMLAAVRQQNLEGVVAKLKDSIYQPGKRMGAWIKYRINRGQELVVGGYIPGPHGFDSLIVGYYRGKDLVYVARVRNGFVPASRRQVFSKIRSLVSPKMPFVNLPDQKESRWGDSLTADKMRQCVWLVPKIVAQIEFLEWTAGDRLRHSKFVGLREDKDPPISRKGIENTRQYCDSIRREPAPNQIQEASPDATQITARGVRDEHGGSDSVGGLSAQYHFLYHFFLYRPPSPLWCWWHCTIVSNLLYQGHLHPKLITGIHQQHLPCDVYHL